MSETPAIPPELSKRILRHFGLPANLSPNLHALRQLVERYTATVPWESASRIVRRAEHARSDECILLGEAFWESHFAQGTGGTCYESNYAFFGLLRRLGYEGYLTINDIGGAAGCHSAIVIRLDGNSYLVDVGYPVYVVLPIRADEETRADSLIMDFSLAPMGGDSYQLKQELRDRVAGFTLHNTPVCDADYRAIAIHDYRHDGGQFLDVIKIHMVVDGQLWRFNSDERPRRLQQFIAGQRHDHWLGADAAGEAGAKFGLARDVVADALSILS